MKPTLIIGLGTGRCGTHSLTEVLNAQRGVRVIHEDRPILHWNPQQEPSNVVARFQAKINDSHGQVVGEVALFLLPYTARLLDVFPQAKAVVLRRPREEVVQSYVRWIRRAYSQTNVNHWQQNVEHVPVLWDRPFPKFRACSMEGAIGRYWDWYVGHAEELIHCYPGRVRCYSMLGVLNDPETQQECLRWLGIRDPQWHRAWASVTRKPTGLAPCSVPASVPLER